MKCPTCNRDTYFTDGEGHCPKCTPEDIKRSEHKVEPDKKKRKGRKPWKTEEEKAKVLAEYLERTKKDRALYMANRHKKKYKPAKIGQYVVYHDGLFKAQGHLDKNWDEFKFAKIYKSFGLAGFSIHRTGKGVVMKKFATKKETLEKWEEMNK